MRQSKQARVILYRNKTDEDQARIINGNRVPATNNEETELIVEIVFVADWNTSSTTWGQSQR